MGQAVLTVAGQVIGSYFGPVGAAIGGAIGSAVGGALFPQELGRHEGPRLSDMRSQVSTYGASIPVLYGRCAPAGCVIWAAPLREVTTEEEVGGKGGGPTATQVSYSYFASFAVTIAQGEMASLSRIWINGKCFYDVRDEGNGEAMVASANFANYFKWYPGSETQDPDPTLEAALGVGNVPAYRGTSYIVFTDLPLELVNNIPIGGLNCQFEVTHAGAKASGLRVLESVDNLGVDGLLYPVAIGSGTFRMQAQAAAYVPGTRVYNYAGEFICVDAATADEGLWPSPIFGFESDGTVEVVLAWDGTMIRSALAGTRIGAPEMKLYAGEPGLGVSALPLIAVPGTSYCYGCVPAADRRHICVFTGPFGGYVDAYWLLRWNGTGAGWSLVSTGTAPGDAGGDAESIASQWVYYAGCMESDLQHVWAVSAQGDPYVKLWKIDETTGAMSAVADFTGATPTPGYIFSSCRVWADQGMAWAIYSGYGHYRMYTRIDGTGANTEDLADVVADICARCGLSAGEIDVTDLVGIAVDGFMWAGVTPGRAALEHLRRAYWFDAAESGGKIKFVRRGQSSAATLTVDDLGASEGDAVELVASERVDEDTLPAFIALAYLTKDADYQPGVQTQQREAAITQQPATVELPLVLSDTAARRVADVLLYDGWIGRNKRNFSTSRAFARLEPTDVVTLDLGDVSYLVRIAAARHAGAIIAFEAVDEDVAVYAPASDGGTIEDGGALAVPGATKVALLDVPLLRDMDDDAGFYAAMCGYLSSWPGGRLYRSADGGANFSSVMAFGEPAVLGFASNALAAYAGGNFYDTSATLTVRLLSGTLSSVTDAQLLAGANAAAVGTEAGGYEILQFRDAALVGTNTYTLSTLLRGRRGTEWLQGSHAIGDTFVLLTAAAARRVPDAVDALNSERLFRAVSYGQRLSDVANVAFTNTGAGLKPYSPVHARASGWGGELTIAWTRRGRLQNGWMDLVDVPLGEAAASYEVDIYDAPGTTVLRTLATSSASVAYSSALQIVDFGSNPTSLKVRIYQLSATVGRGFPCIATLSA